MSGTATVSLGRVAFLDDGTWRADPSGAPAVMIPVLDRFNDWVDILAYHVNDPCEWRLRFGDSCPLLGAEALAMATYYHDPVTLCSTPERWLRARCRTLGDGHLDHLGDVDLDHLGDDQHHGDDQHQAICILHWGVELGPLFEGVSRIECDSPELRDRFRKAIRSWEPKITAPRQAFSPARSFREARDAA